MSGYVDIEAEWVYDFDEQHRLVAVTDPGGQTATNIYDHDGQRVVRIDSDGTRTVYIGDTELRHDPVTQSVTTSRRYPGGVVRQYGGDIVYTTSNHQGSVTHAVNATTGTGTRTSYEPYGEIRDDLNSGGGAGVDDHGFLNHINDVHLTYLNNRHYDPTTGVFVSVDPLVTKTMQPYIYGAANPITYSDPSGLDPDTSSQVRSQVEANGGCTYSSGLGCFQNLPRPDGRADRNPNNARRRGERLYAQASLGYGPAPAPPAEMRHRYEYQFLIGRYGPDGPGLVGDLFFSDPNRSFPFGIPGPIEVGSEFELNDGIPGYAGVRVSFLDERSLGFESLEGHPEGAGNFILFNFRLDEWGQTVLYVDSWGPPETTVLDAPVARQVNIVFTKNIWNQFAKSLGFIGNQTLETYPCCPDF